MIPFIDEVFELDLLLARERAAAWARLLASDDPLLLKVNSGNDHQADAMGLGTAGAAATGTATTAPGTTTATLDGAGAPGSTSAWNGRIITMGAAFGVILSNTNVSSPVVTIDRWYDPTSATGAAASTPAAGRWIILPGNAPGQWMAITTDATSPAAGDTTLASELTNAGLLRKVATYAHTGGANTFTLSAQFTNPDATARTINKMGTFEGQNGSRMIFETLVPNPPVLASSTDSVTLTDTITM